MAQYLIKGVVIPERAQLSLSNPITAKVTHAGTAKQLTVELSIYMNQITAWIEADSEWDIFDLRNIIRYYVNNICSHIGFVKGLAYEMDIRQIHCKERGIDYVFGIDVPCISARHPDEQETNFLLNDILQKTKGETGISINRCMSDLKMALNHSEDTAFYCYRGLESLKQYCMHRYGIQNELDQWQKVVELSGYDRSYITDIKNWAGVERHGDIANYSGKDREEMLTKTWSIVEAFLKNI